MAKNDNKQLIGHLEARYKNEKQLADLKISMLEEEKSRLGSILDYKRRIAIEEEIANEHQKIINMMVEAQNDALEEGYAIHTKTTIALGDRIKEQQNLIDNQKKSIKNSQTMLDLQVKIKGLIKQGISYLMDQDRIIKSTILGLGLSGEKAHEMRLSFEESAGLVARLGGGLEDVKTIMTGFADETGRARILSSEMVKDIFVIGKGTAIGVENATRLATQFELMGYNARSTMEYVQGVVETSELMGVNTTNVLKNITEQFKKLQRYTFRQGVQGFADMAMYAEKFKIDMGDALASAEMSRNLEHAIDLAANLQVLGGEFAKTDPFQLLFSARNDPEDYAKKLNKMTIGLASYRKVIGKDGKTTFQNFISPADIDRLTQAEKSLGLQTGELTIQARRMSELQRMRQQMIGMGLSKKEKTLVEGMSTFSTKTGRFTVEIAGATKDMAELTANDLKVLEKHNESLEKRAEAAQTFDEVWKATIEEFKTVLLPMLQGINRLLEWLRPTVIAITEWVTKGPHAWMKVAGTFLGAAVLLKAAGVGISFAANALRASKLGGFLSSAGSTTSSTTSSVTKGAGGRALGVGAGVGAAALGVGGGIALAATGISKLADSMSGLNKDQAEALETIGTTLAITFPLAGIGIAFAGKMAETSALGIGVLTAAVVALGFGINIATKGIGFMAESLAKLKSAKADSFVKISTAMKGSKEDFKDVDRAVKSIASADLSNLKPLTKLSRVLNKPLQVEFVDKEVAIVSNVTLKIDGYQFHEATNTAGYVTTKLNNIRNKEAVPPSKV